MIDKALWRRSYLVTLSRWSPRSVTEQGYYPLSATNKIRSSIALNCSRLARYKCGEPVLV